MLYRKQQKAVSDGPGNGDRVGVYFWICTALVPRLVTQSTHLRTVPIVKHPWARVGTEHPVLLFQRFLGISAVQQVEDCWTHPIAVH